MNAVDYLKARERMCSHFRYSKKCADCPLFCPYYGCASFEAIDPEDAVPIVEKWAKKNPEERRWLNEKRCC